MLSKSASISLWSHTLQTRLAEVVGAAKFHTRFKNPDIVASCQHDDGQTRSCPRAPYSGDGVEARHPV